MSRGSSIRVARTVLKLLSVATTTTNRCLRYVAFVTVPCTCADAIVNIHADPRKSSNLEVKISGPRDVLEKAMVMEYPGEL